MNKLAALLVALVFSVSCIAAESPEIRSTIAWLGMMDSGNYAESWDASAPLFQSHVSRGDWDQALSRVRAPLGALLSREVNSTSQHASLPGVPDGEYLVVTFKTRFENKESVTETVTLSRVGSEWLPVGYFIK